MIKVIFLEFRIVFMIISETHYQATALGKTLQNGSRTSLFSFGFYVLFDYDVFWFFP